MTDSFTRRSDVVDSMPLLEPATLDASAEFVVPVVVPVVDSTAQNPTEVESSDVPVVRASGLSPIQVAAARSASAPLVAPVDRRPYKRSLSPSNDLVDRRVAVKPKVASGVAWCRCETCSVAIDVDLAKSVPLLSCRCDHCVAQCDLEQREFCCREISAHHWIKCDDPRLLKLLTSGPSGTATTAGQKRHRIYTIVASMCMNPEHLRLVLPSCVRAKVRERFP